MPQMDPFYEGLTVLGDYKHRGIEMKLARKRTGRIVAFGKRDFAFVSVSDHPQDGAWVSGTVSVVTDEIPRRRGYVRAYQDSIAFYEGMDDDAVTGRPRMKLTIVFRLDLNDSREGGEGGYIPMAIYKLTVGRTGMLSVQNMKRQLNLQMDEREGLQKFIDGKGGGNRSVDGRGSCEDNNWLVRVGIGQNKCDNAEEGVERAEGGSCEHNWLARMGIVGPNNNCYSNGGSDVESCEENWLVKMGIGPSKC